MLDDIGRPTPEQLGRALGVTPRTVRRWLADDDAPRPVLLALFWITRWGMSAADCEAANAAVLAGAHVRALRDENAALAAELAHALALANSGAANDASWRVQPLARVLPFRPRHRPAA